MADFSTAMRQALLDACALDWSSISPAIFGSLFQSIMDDKARRNLGAHYTSEATRELAPTSSSMREYLHHARLSQRVAWAHCL
jgi:hypothetical protein